MSSLGLGCVKTGAEQKWSQLSRSFDVSTFDAFRCLSSKSKISNVRELGHEFSHSLGQGRSKDLGEVTWRRSISFASLFLGLLTLVLTGRATIELAG
jgi:hypothetical protein